MTASFRLGVPDDLAREISAIFPQILDNLQLYRRDPGSPDALYEVSRMLRRLEVSADLAGRGALARAARYGEDVIQAILTGTRELQSDTRDFFTALLVQIENYVGRAEAAEPGDEDDLLIGATLAYRRYLGLPEDEDEAAILELLGDGDAEPVATAVAEPTADQPPVPFDWSTSSPYPELLEMFASEAPERMQVIARLLPEYARSPERKDLLQEIRRSVHTLKGEANVVGQRPIGQLAHRMEDALDRLYDDEMRFSPEVEQLLLASADALAELIADGGQSADVREAVEEAYAGYAAILGDVEAEVAPEPTEELVRLEADLEPAPTPTASDADASELSVRVPLKRLDEIVRLMSELVIGRSAMQQRLDVFSREVEELSLGVARMRRMTTKLETEYEVAALAGRLSPATNGVVAVNGQASPRVYESFAARDFDDLEFDRYTEFHLVSRQITETNADIDAVGQKLRSVAGEFDVSINRLGRMTNELQEKIMRLRMVPFAAIVTRLNRTVRVTAAKKRKLADLVVRGDGVELDKATLEGIADPLMHMLRNAVDHGIETPTDRLAAGKSETGRITIEVAYEGAEIVIRVGDDGAGLNCEKLRAKALAEGLYAEADIAALSDEQLHRLIFLPGFTTAREISDVSGRGVGMDVVRATVERFKGSVSIHSTFGQGVTFVIRLPLTLAVRKAFLVRQSGETYAVPFALAKRIAQTPGNKIEKVGRQPMIRLQGTTYPVIWLGDLLDLDTDATKARETLSMLILQVAERQVALVVDEIVEQREVVVKTLGDDFGRIPGVSGVTLMGDGSVVVILNPAELMRDAVSQPVRRRAATPVRRETLDVLIVDDSLSLRTLVSNLVKQQVGWTPALARDGLEALQYMQSAAKKPDVIVLDVEMPRMDGYELAATLRADPQCRNIPIVMLTSRAGEKHRRKAFEVGATDYLVKPYQDDQLLSVIRRVTGRAANA
jgi:chemosensory pili system protein ChpA (sensor histidine kinase/response regulator)